MGGLFQPEADPPVGKPTDLLNPEPGIVRKHDRPAARRLPLGRMSVDSEQHREIPGRAGLRLGPAKVLEFKSCPVGRQGLQRKDTTLPAPALEGGVRASGIPAEGVGLADGGRHGHSEVRTAYGA